ncbi:MAG: thioredoxin domain-containing protein, partial [Rhodocyclaceae bacterium]|nr:thioredoxin domain-containing protein [Rhodocyclaceae bacterium]
METPNRLAAETSPYLLQHADNPVAWQPWSEAALTQARTEDRPILLSIGYSACHWCHVMAHESFEDEATAAVMNRLFVNIKVDREERPDLDQIYQTAHQMLTGRAGGWPLTMFLTPDGTPFFGGTYFPTEPRHGLPGFTGLCEQIGTVWQTRRADIEAQNRELLGALNRPAPAPAAAAPDHQPVAVLRTILLGSFDRQLGGFGRAPKFPHPTDLAFLLHRPDDPEAREAALFTLRRMAEGGIHDQLGGGFCRYSVDERWEIPHFEKMLYDNGPLLGLYADAFALTGDPCFREVAEGIAGWVLREMTSPDGAFHSSLDADSEGEEGRYYVWDRAEVAGLLTTEESALAGRHWGLDGPPNFEGRHWHLKVAVPLAEAETALLA